MSSHYPWKYVLLSSIVAVSLLVMSWANTASILVAPDSIGLVCGAEHLMEQGSFSPLRTDFQQFDYLPCWTAKIYPSVQLLVAGFGSLMGNAEYGFALTLILLSIVFPLSLATLAWRLTKNRHLTHVVAGLAAVTPAALSTLQLTPQGYAGTIVLIFTLALVAHPHTRLRIWAWTLPLLVLLFFTHTLSFFFASMFLSIFWLAYKPTRLHVIWFVVGVAVAAGLCLLALAREDSIRAIIDGLLFQLRVIDNFQTRSVFDHASYFGYMLIPLAVYGVCSRVWSIAQRWIILSITVVPLLLTHMYILGISFLPHRMLWYATIGIVVLAGAGVVELLKHTGGHRAVTLICVTLCAALLCLQTVVVSKNNLHTYGEQLVLEEDYVEAASHLTQLTSDQVVLTVMTSQHRQGLHLARLISADIISFPAHQLSNAREFQISQPFWNKLAETNPSDPLIVDLRNITDMTEHPTRAKASDLYTQYNVKAILLRKKTPEAKIFARQSGFSVLYENDSYIIYQP